MFRELFSEECLLVELLLFEGFILKLFVLFVGLFEMLKVGFVWWSRNFVFNFWFFFWWSLLIFLEVFLLWIWFWKVWEIDWLENIDLLIVVLFICNLCMFCFFVWRGLLIVKVFLVLNFMSFDNFFFNCNRFLLIGLNFVWLILYFELFIFLLINGLGMLLFFCFKVGLCVCVYWVIFFFFEFFNWLGIMLLLLLFVEVFLLFGIMIFENLIIIGGICLFCFFLFMDELLFFFLVCFVGDMELDFEFVVFFLCNLFFLFLCFFKFLDFEKCFYFLFWLGELLNLWKCERWFEWLICCVVGIIIWLVVVCNVLLVFIFNVGFCLLYFLYCCVLFIKFSGVLKFCFEFNVFRDNLLFFWLRIVLCFFFGFWKKLLVFFGWNVFGWLVILNCLWFSCVRVVVEWRVVVECSFMVEFEIDLKCCFFLLLI